MNVAARGFLSLALGLFAILLPYTTFAQVGGDGLTPAERAELVALRTELTALKAQLITTASKDEISLINTQLNNFSRETGPKTVAAVSQTITLTRDGCALTFIKSGTKAGCVAVRTTPGGRLQLVLEGTQGPAITIGGDRQPADVQITPAPVNRPPMHFTVGHTQAGTQENAYGDVYISGTLTIAPRTVAFDQAGASVIPIDPRGSLIIARGYANSATVPNTEDRSMIRMFLREENTTNPSQEKVRFGVTLNGGYPFISPGHSGPGPLQFRFDGNHNKLQLVYKRPSDAKEAILDFTETGSLRYVSPGGTVTPIGSQ